MTDINFEAKTDRELLLLTAQCTNTMEEHLAKLNGRVFKLEEAHNKLKRNFFILVAFMTGSGALGGGIWAMLH